ncbi:uncharacterized protein LOC135483446 [Lineus longissimus]|uniref:uncharacterized protein LOC135483446 n=1 Tax=Lineus longissimus TaxID=88925 RepID=UPI002B4EA87A
MVVLYLSLLLLLCPFALAQFSGFNFIGAGYDILNANPDGEAEKIGAVDPGIKLTRRVFSLTYEEERKSLSGVSIPDEVDYAQRDSCATHTLDTMFFGGKSYQKKLNTSVSLGGNYGVPALLAFSFSASGRYKKETSGVTQKKTVYHEEEETCNYGSARYRMELAAAKGYKLEEGFLHAGCKLTTAKSNNGHIDFLSNWGTHVITEAKLGTKKVKRMENKLSQLFEFAMSDVGGAVSIGGTYQGAGGVLKVDVNKFDQEANLEKWQTGETYEYRKGTRERPEPVHITLASIDSVFIPSFWNGAPCSFTADDLTKIQQNLRKAMEYYPRMLGLGLPKDPVLQYKLSWPKGTYAMQESDKGCPDTRWLKGRRIQTTGDGNTWEPNGIHWPQGTLTDGEITQSFCTKSLEDGEFAWQKGQYCIFKVKQCPDGFEEGSLTWDDYGSKEENLKKFDGSMPEGEYAKNTKIYFCCRNDGLAGNPIFLPTEVPFYLLAKVKKCQIVQNMRVTQEIIRWDDENFWNLSARDGSHPYDTSPSGKNHKLHYCYYRH